MQRVSFVHCGDIHLGCQQFNEIQRWHDFGDAFSEIVDYAIEQTVDFVLIAGDLFHHRSINAATLGQAMLLLGKLKAAGIEVIAIEGNHDKAFYLEKDSWMSFLNQQGYIRLLKPEFTEDGIAITPYDGQKGCITEHKDVQIIGLGYLGATTRQRLEEIALLTSPSDKFTIIMLHAAVDKLLGQDLAGVKREVFESFAGKADYFALGHIHSRHELDDFIFNPGAPECVHIDEAKEDNEKGFYHVSIEGKKKHVQYIQSNFRSVRRFAVDLTDIEEPEQVTSKVFELLKKSDLSSLDKPIVQLNLHGTIKFSSHAIDTNALAENVTKHYLCLVTEVLNNTNLPLASASADVSAFDRAAVERHVLGQMITEEKPAWRGMHGDITEFILRMKKDLLSEVPEEDIIQAVEQLVESLSLDEAAVGVEGGEPNEG